MSEKGICVENMEEYINDEAVENIMAENDSAEEKGCGCGCDSNLGETADLKHHPHGVTCTRVQTQAADVSLPVRIRPYAKMGTVETRCCGEPVVAIRHCGGAEQCRGCDLVITQTICARIPIEYGVTATTGEACITCRRAAESK